MGSDETHLKVSLVVYRCCRVVRGKVARQCPQTTFEEKRGESGNRIDIAIYQPRALLADKHVTVKW